MIPELDARNILSGYDGANNQILEWKLKSNIDKKFKLTRPQAEYVQKYHQIVPKVAKKRLNIISSFGERLMEEKLLPKPPETIWCEKLLCETDKAYHIWGKILDSQQNHAFWLPKVAIIQDEKKLNRVIDYSKYNVRPIFEHQKIAIEKLLANDKFILADDMGLMKTGSSVVASLESGAKKILIVCPASLKINWQREIKIYTDRKTLIVEGNKWGSTFDYYIINYDIVKNYHSLEEDQEINNLIIKEKFDLVIVDEAHYISNNTAARTRLLNDILESIPKVWLLTGTPLTSRPINYYNLLKIVDSPLTLNWQHYVRRYCKGFQFKVGDRKVWSTNGASNLDELRDRTKNLILRRMKTEILDLPEKIVTPIYLEMNDTFYDTELENFMRISNENKKDESITVTLNRLMRIRQLISYEKIPYTCELIDKFLEQSKKVIVFTNFTMTLDMLHEKYGNASVVLDGRMSKEKRQDSIDRFQNDPKVKVFIGNIIAAGVGITLTAAETVIMNDLSFVPAHHSQAEDRCVFKGQLVLTEDGYKKIEDINIGDMVYTHMGNFKTVNGIHSHSERKKIRVDINAHGFNKKLSLTEGHDVYVYNNKLKDFEWVNCDKLNILNHSLTFKSNKQPIERKRYIDVVNYVDEFFLNDYGVEQKNGKLKILPERVELTNELLYAFGFYVAEGWSNDISDVKSCNVSICQKINNKKMDDASVYIINIIKECFNIKNHSEYIDKCNVKTCTIHSKNLAKNFIKWFGKGAKNKRLPQWVDELNNEQLISLIDGFNHGDGYLRKNIQQSLTSSAILGSQLVRYNANLGRNVIFSRIKRKNIEYYQIEYGISTELNKNRIKKINDYIIYPIKSLKFSRPKRGEETVYDLSVNDDHSFVVGNYNVHNCYRYGQKNNVLVYYPIFENTVEMIIYNILQKKKNIIDQVLGDGEYSESFSKDLLSEILKKNTDY